MDDYDDSNRLGHHISLGHKRVSQQKKEYSHFTYICCFLIDCLFISFGHCYVFFIQKNYLVIKHLVIMYYFTFCYVLFYNLTRYINFQYEKYLMSSVPNGAELVAYFWALAAGHRCTVVLLSTDGRQLISHFSDFF